MMVQYILHAIMAGSWKISGSRKLMLFTYIYVVFCGIFYLKTCKTTSTSTWEELYVCVEVTRAINYSKAFKRRRTSKQRTLANPLKLILGLRLMLYASYSVFLIMLSGDVEINPGPRRKEDRSVKCVTTNARSLTSLVTCIRVTKAKKPKVISRVYRSLCTQKTLTLFVLMRLGCLQMFTTQKFYIQDIILSETIVKRAAVVYCWG